MADRREEIVKPRRLRFNDKKIRCISLIMSIYFKFGRRGPSSIYLLLYDKVQSLTCSYWAEEKYQSRMHNVRIITGRFED
jgi:hypothetical protein